jgi:hypothetical protein
VSYTDAMLRLALISAAYNLDPQLG